MGPPEIGADPGLPMSPAQVGAHKQKGRVLCWGPPPHYPKWSWHPSGPQPPVFLIRKFLGLWPTPKGWELEGIESPVEHESSIPSAKNWQGRKETSVLGSSQPMQWDCLSTHTRLALYGVQRPLSLMLGFQIKNQTCGR